MSGKTVIVGYQIGYRTKGIGSYEEPYTDLPMHRVGVTTIEARWDATSLLEKMQADFPKAEWRIVECWE